MSRRPRSTRSARRGGRAGLPSHRTRSVPAPRVSSEASLDAVMRTVMPIPGLCTGCGSPSRDVEAAEFHRLWAGVSDHEIGSGLSDDTDPESLWWCDDCPRGGGFLVWDGERVPFGIGAACPCCA